MAKAKSKITPVAEDLLTEEIALDFLMGPDYSSQGISWFGLGPGGYSHCASVLKDGRYLDARNDRLPVGERADQQHLFPEGFVPPGVHTRDPNTERWIRKRRARLAVTAADYTYWEEGLRAKIGDSYARSDIAGYLFDRGLHEPGHYVCSALLINQVQHLTRGWGHGRRGYIPFPLWAPAHQITPNVALFLVQVAGFTLDPEIVA